MHAFDWSRNRRAWRRVGVSASIIALTATIGLTAGGSSLRVAAQQGGTPEAEAPVIQPPTQNDIPALDPTATPIPAVAAPTVAAPSASTGVEASEIDPAAPHMAVLAQGLVALEEPVVWRVREVAPLPAESAPSETGGFSFTLQRSGTSIIRNDVTSKRARLEPGEAYFMSADDPYTRRAEGTAPSVTWVMELVAPNAPAGDPVRSGTVIFTGPTPYTYPSGTFDAELSRNVLQPNEQAALPAHTGPALIVTSVGSIETTDGASAPTTLAVGGGQVVEGPLTLRNATTAPAAYTVAIIGDRVENAGPAAPIPAAGGTPVAPAPVPAQTQADATALPDTGQTPVPDQQAVEPTASTAEPPAPDAAPSPGDTDGDGLSDEDEVALGTDPLNRDFDVDGLLDGREVNQIGTDPLNDDSDGDGLKDGAEVDQYGTSPLSADTDGDGTTDGDEVFTYGTDPLDPASGP